MTTSRTLAVAEYIAPELRDVAERFPNPVNKGVVRLRLPGGLYRPIGQPAIAVQVVHGTRHGASAWEDGTTPAGWAVIGAAVSEAGIPATTYLPPHARAKPLTEEPFSSRPTTPQRPRSTAPGPVSGTSAPGQVDGPSAFERFVDEHPIEAMVDLERRGSRYYFKAPWRDERTASVLLNDDGSWHDFGDQKHGRDAFDLWCAMNGHWDVGRNRPDRAAGLRALRDGQTGRLRA